MSDTAKLLTEKQERLLTGTAALPPPEQRIADARQRLQENPALGFEVLWEELKNSRQRMFAVEQEINELRQSFQQHTHDQFAGRVMVPASSSPRGVGVGAGQILGNSVPEWVRQVETQKL